MEVERIYDAAIENFAAAIVVLAAAIENCAEAIEDYAPGAIAIHSAAIVAAVILNCFGAILVDSMFLVKIVFAYAKE